MLSAIKVTQVMTFYTKSKFALNVKALTGFGLFQFTNSWQIFLKLDMNGNIILNNRHSHLITICYPTENNIHYSYENGIKLLLKLLGIKTFFKHNSLKMYDWYCYHTEM